MPWPTAPKPSTARPFDYIPLKQHVTNVTRVCVSLAQKHRNSFSHFFSPFRSFCLRCKRFRRIFLLLRDMKSGFLVCVRQQNVCTHGKTVNSHLLLALSLSLPMLLLPLSSSSSLPHTWPSFIPN